MISGLDMAIMFMVAWVIGVVAYIITKGMEWVTTGMDVGGINTTTVLKGIPEGVVVITISTTIGIIPSYLLSHVYKYREVLFGG